MLLLLLLLPERPPSPIHSLEARRGKGKRREEGREGASQCTEAESGRSGEEKDRAPARAVAGKTVLVVLSLSPSPLLPPTHHSSCLRKGKEKEEKEGDGGGSREGRGLSMSSFLLRLSLLMVFSWAPLPTTWPERTDEGFPPFDCCLPLSIAGLAPSLSLLSSLSPPQGRTFPSVLQLLPSHSTSLACSGRGCFPEEERKV